MLPTLRKITIALLLIQCISFQIAAEDGMGLVTSQTAGGSGYYGFGQIRRIDMKSSAVINTTSGLNGGAIGHNMRFNPRGDQFAYLFDTTQIVRICTIDGVLIRSFTAPNCNTDGAGYISWTNSGIWVSGGSQFLGSLSLYDTLGTHIKDYTGQGLMSFRTYVSQNDKTGTCVDESGSWRPWVFSMIRGVGFQLSIPTGAEEGGCSVCPSPDGRLLTNNNVLNSQLGYVIDHHKSMRIMDTLGNMVQFILLQDATKFPAAGYRWNTQAWSGNSNDWIIIPVGQEPPGGSWTPDANLSACIYNINSKEKICLKDNSGTNQIWFIYDYYSGKVPGVAAPALLLTPSTLSFAADSGAGNPTTQTVNASTANGTLQGLTITGAKPWLTVTPGATTGASISIANSPNIAGMAPNTYLDTITVATTNASSAKYVVTLTVRRPGATAILASMTVSPLQYTIAPGASVNFLATCKDQSGNYFTNATLTWSAGGGGAIDQTGKFTAAAAPSDGPHLVIATATNGATTVRDTAKIMVMRPKFASVYKRIDCGANSLLPAGWETDDAYVTGGSDGANLASVSVTGVAAAAPADVYRSFRRANPHSYHLPHLPIGPYTVRMHLVDWKDTVRSMSYSILGVNVINGLRIVPLAGAINKALVLDFGGMIQDTNGLSITCTAQSGDVFEAGFEAIENRLAAVCLLWPLGGANQRFAIGQTIQVQWVCDTLQCNDLYIKLSVDGRTYLQAAPRTSRIDNRAAWGNYAFTIPDSIGPAGSRISTISTKCRVKLEAYSSPDPNNPIADFSDSAFTTVAAAGVRNTGGFIAKNQLRCGSVNGRLMIHASSENPYAIEVYAPDGERIFAFAGIRDRHFTLQLCSAGSLIVCMRTAPGMVLTKLIGVGAQ